MLKNEFEQLLESSLDVVSDSRVKDAMRYSLLGGGKRIRPLLLYEVLNGYGVDERVGNPCAIALEMVHTYSLIHDDLPAMDNDVLRRGRNTCHIEFDEATAILAGDGLLTLAFEIIANSNISESNKVKCINILSQSAGPSGMILGQCLDINESNDNDWEDIKRVHHYKTGCLLSAPLQMGAILSNQSDEIVDIWKQIGFNIGLAFQIQDDILDIEKTDIELGKSNSDITNNKITSVSLLGLEKAKLLMNNLYSDSFSVIDNLKGFKSECFLHFLSSIQNRTY